MRLLIYNWAQFDNPQMLGGGVSVYLKRIIPALVQQGAEVIFLSVATDTSTQVKVVRSENCFAELGVVSYFLLNSSVPYPHNRAFGKENLIDNKEVLEVFQNFVMEQKPDVVHFHSIEGVPAGVLRLKQLFPRVKWWFTAHNFHLLCQQIQLFNNRHNRNCDDFLSGQACRTCQWQDYDNISFKGMMEHRVPWAKKALAMRAKIVLGKKRRPAEKEQELVSCREKADASWLNRSVGGDAEYFSNWRAYNIESVHNYLDSVVAVSRQQKELLCQLGLDSRSVQVLNPAVSNQKFNRVPPSQSAITTISYWGYSNPGTGLSLFLDSLELLACRYPSAKSLNVLIVSDTGRRFRDRLALLAPHFKKVELVKRYDQESMKSLAAEVDLAVVCPILRETYCQVAAELYFFGVPVLASSTLGFAGEHINDQRFVFRSASEVNLVERLIALLEDPSLLGEYWNTTSAPMLLERHAENLISAYKRNSTESAA